MKSRYRYLLKNTGILTISNFSSKVLVFFLVPLYTSVLTTEEYGTYDLISTSMQLIMPFLSFNIYEAVMRFVMDKEVNKKEVASVGMKYVLIGIFAFTVIVGINKALFLWKDLAKYSEFVIAYFASSLFYQYTVQLTKGLERIKDMAIAGILGTVATIFLNIVLLLVYNFGLSGFYIAYIAGQAIPALYLIVRIRLWNLMTKRISPKLERAMILYALPLIMNTIGWWANSVSDRYVVTIFCGVAVNGIYSVSYKIPTILSTLQQIFNQAWQISAVKEYQSADSNQFYGKALSILNFLMCIVCMILILMTKPIAKILFAKDFYQAWQYVPFLLVAGVFNTAAGILGPVLTARRNSKAIGQSAVYSAVINMALNVVFVFYIGAQGAAIATAISSLCIFIFRKRATGKIVCYSNQMAMIASWIIVSLQAFLEIYTHFYIAQIVLLLILLYVYKRECKTLFDLGYKILFERI